MSDGAHLERVEAIFHQALDMPTGERTAFIRRACADDTGLRRAVERLLEADTGADEFLPEGGAEAHLAAHAMRERAHAGTTLGPYVLRRLLGFGGMGEVWLADRADEQFDMAVAIKMLRHDIVDESILRRFRDERRVLAGLQHPNIARLLDGGTTDDGRPYFVMEYVEGTPLDQYCDEHGLTIADRLQLFEKVCRAVQHAHANLVVHRDLKPGNILVSSDGEPKLLDFGIAKLIDPGDRPDRDVTRTALRVMTPRYASPEQVRGESVTTATDVYSLGVILYELLTGRRPHQTSTSTIIEIERAIVDQAPRRPSTTVLHAPLPGPAESAPAWTPEQIGAARGVEPRRLQRLLAGDLDTITLMALRKEPERRYASVEQFATDVRNHLDGRPVLARPDTVAYRTSRVIRRNRVGVSAAAVGLMAIVGGLIASSILYVRADRARVAAELAEGREREQREIADQRTREAVWGGYVASMYAASAALDNTDRSAAEPHLEHAPAEHRGWEWDYLEGQVDRAVHSIRAGVRLYAVAISPDASLLACAGAFPSSAIGTIELYDSRTGEQLAVLSGHRRWIRDLDFSHDGALLASAGIDGQVIQWDVRTGTPVREFDGHRGQTWCVRFSPDGATLLSADDTGYVMVRDASSGEVLLALEHEHAVRTAAFGPDGLIATGTRDGMVTMWRGEQRLFQDLSPGQSIHDVGFDDTDDTLVAVISRSAVRRWTLGGTLVRETPVPATADVLSELADSTRLAAARTRERTVIVWDTTSGEILSELRGPVAMGINDITFSRDEGRILIGSWERELMLFDRSGTPPFDSVMTPLSQLTCLAVSPDGRTIAVGGDDGRIVQYDAATLLLLDDRVAHEALVTDLVFRDDRTLVSTGLDGAIRVHDLESWREEALVRSEGGEYAAVAVGERFLAAGNATHVELFDASSHALLRTIGPFERPVSTLSLSAGDHRLVVGLRYPINASDARSVRIVDPARGVELAAYEGGQETIAFSIDPSGSDLAIATSNIATLRTLETGALLGRTPSMRMIWRVFDVAFLPDGDRLVTAGTDATVRVLDRATMETVLVLRMANWAHGVGVDPAGRWIAAGGRRGQLLIWRVTEPAERVVAETVRRLWASHPDVNAVRAALDADPWLSHADRARAIALAQRLSSSADELAGTSRRIRANR